MIRITFDFDEAQADRLVLEAMKRGFTTENPKRRMNKVEKREAIEYAIDRLVMDKAGEKLA